MHPQLQNETFDGFIKDYDKKQLAFEKNKLSFNDDLNHLSDTLNVGPTVLQREESS